MKKELAVLVAFALLFAIVEAEPSPSSSSSSDSSAVESAADSDGQSVDWSKVKGHSEGWTVYDEDGDATVYDKDGNIIQSAVKDYYDPYNLYADEESARNDPYNLYDRSNKEPLPAASDDYEEPADSDGQPIDWSKVKDVKGTAKVAEEVLSEAGEILGDEEISSIASGFGDAGTVLGVAVTGAEGKDLYDRLTDDDPSNDPTEEELAEFTKDTGDTVKDIGKTVGKYAPNAGKGITKAIPFVGDAARIASVVAESDADKQKYEEGKISEREFHENVSARIADTAIGVIPGGDAVNFVVEKATGKSAGQLFAPYAYEFDQGPTPGVLGIEPGERWAPVDPTEYISPGNEPSAQPEPDKIEGEHVPYAG